MKLLLGALFASHLLATSAARTTSRLRQPKPNQRRRREKERALRPLGVKPKPRVVGGVDAEAGRYPYNVALVDGFGYLICGGTLIAPDVVMTVSHCQGMARAQIGRYNMRKNTDDFDDLKISFQYKHPFNTGYGPYEFKLLKLGGTSSKSYIRLNDNPSVPAPGIQGTCVVQQSLVLLFLLDSVLTFVFHYRQAKFPQWALESPTLLVQTKQITNSPIIYKSSI